MYAPVVRIAGSAARVAVRRTASVPVAAVAGIGARRALTAGARIATTPAPAPSLATTAMLGVAGLGLATAGTVAFADSVDYDAVRKAIADMLDVEDYDDGSYGPLLVRLAWHASGTFDKKDGSGGSCGATMRYSPESADGANAGLDVARNLLEPIKAKFPGISYADLWTLAGCVAIEEMGGPHIEWRAGRTDTDDRKKVPANGRLPDANLGRDHLRDVFYRMGFNDQEIVALSGAHAMGRAHTDRSGFKGPWTNAPTTFSNEFFRLLLDEKSEGWTRNKVKETGNFQFNNAKKGGGLMMLNTDMELTRDPSFRKYVELYAKDGDKFEADFAAAFKKLIELGVEFPEAKKSLWSRIFG